MASDEELAAQLVGSEEILRVYKRKDGQLISTGLPLSRADAKKAAYFVIERYAQFLDMTVPGFIMLMMREYEEST